MFYAGQNKGVVIGSVIAGSTVLVLVVLSIVLIVILCLKCKQVSKGAQQEIQKDSYSQTAQQLQYHMLSEMKSNDAYLPNTHQVPIETEDNVAYYHMYNNHDHDYSNDQYENMAVEDYYSTIPQ